MANTGIASYLELRFLLSDGAVEHFYQDNEAAAKRIFEHLRPGQLFKQSRIMLAGTYSMTAFLPTHVSKIDLVCADLVCWDFPAGLSDIVELPEAQFRE